MLVIFVLFGFWIILEIIWYLSAKDKAKYKSVLLDVRIGLKNSQRRPYFIVFFLYLLLALGYPLALLSTELFTPKITTQGRVIQKYVSSITEYRRYGATINNKIDAIEVEDANHHVVIFNLENYPSAWDKATINSYIIIRHYPFIDDSNLEISND